MSKVSNNEVGKIVTKRFNDKLVPVDDTRGINGKSGIFRFSRPLNKTDLFSEISQWSANGYKTEKALKQSSITDFSLDEVVAVPALEEFNKLERISIRKGEYKVLNFKAFYFNELEPQLDIHPTKRKTRILKYASDKKAFYMFYSSFTNIDLIKLTRLILYVSRTAKSRNTKHYSDNERVKATRSYHMLLGGTTFFEVLSYLASTMTNNIFFYEDMEMFNFFARDTIAYKKFIEKRREKTIQEYRRRLTMNTRGKKYNNHTIVSILEDLGILIRLFSPIKKFKRKYGAFFINPYFMYKELVFQDTLKFDLENSDVRVLDRIGSFETKGTSALSGTAMFKNIFELRKMWDKLIVDTRAYKQGSIPVFMLNPNWYPERYKMTEALSDKYILNGERISKEWFK